MLTSTAEAAPRVRPAYRNFRVEVARVERLSPTFTSITFTGDDLADFGTAGLDQRVKVVLPLRANGFASFPDGEDWYTSWRELPGELRNPFRTYTVRAVRPQEREVDVVFAGHGDGGPAVRPSFSRSRRSSSAAFGAPAAARPCGEAPPRRSFTGANRMCKT